MSPRPPCLAPAALGPVPTRTSRRTAHGPSGQGAARRTRRARTRGGRSRAAQWRRQKPAPSARSLTTVCFGGPLEAPTPGGSGRQDLNLRPSGPQPLNSGRRPLCAVAVAKSEVRPVAVGVGGESRGRWMAGASRIRRCSGPGLYCHREYMASANGDRLQIRVAPSDEAVPGRERLRGRRLPRRRRGGCAGLGAARQPAMRIPRPCRRPWSRSAMASLTASSG